MARVGLAVTAAAVCVMTAGCGGGSAPDQAASASSHPAPRPTAAAFPPAATGKPLTEKVAGFPETYRLVGMEVGPSLMGASAPADPGKTQYGFLMSVRPQATDRTSPVSVGNPYSGILYKGTEKDCPMAHGDNGCYLTDTTKTAVYPEQQVRGPGGRNLLHPEDVGSGEGAQRLSPGTTYYQEIFLSDVPQKWSLAKMRLCEDPTTVTHCTTLAGMPKLPPR